jgi:citrate lyase subunit beta/citryl-CoA lyase
VIGSLSRARSFLFVPGDRPERFAKARAAGADVVVIDLEDAVAPGAKQSALDNVMALGEGAAEFMIRINDPRTPRGEADVVRIAALPFPVGLLVAKAEDAAVLVAVHDALTPGSVIVPLVETARGVLEVRAIAAAAGVARMAFGHLDLCAELGIAPDDVIRLSPARFALVTASAEAGLVAPVDGVCTEVHDGAVVMAQTRDTVASGFTGKLCIHPAQVPFVHQALAPPADELTRARRILQEASEHQVVLVDGEMVDRPVYRRARSVVDRAGGLI